MAESTESEVISTLCEEQDLNLHTLRYRNLKAVRDNVNTGDCSGSERQAEPEIAPKCPAFVLARTERIPGRFEHPTVGLEGRWPRANEPAKQESSDGAVERVADGVAEHDAGAL